MVEWKIFKDWRICGVSCFIPIIKLSKHFFRIIEVFLGLSNHKFEKNVMRQTESYFFQIWDQNTNDLIRIMLVLQKFNILWSCCGDLLQHMKNQNMIQMRESNEFPSKQIAKMWSITITFLFWKQFITKSNWVFNIYWTFCLVMC